MATVDPSGISESVKDLHAELTPGRIPSERSYREVVIHPTDCGGPGADH